MLDGLVDHAFTPDQLERLGAVGEIDRPGAARRRSTTTAPPRCSADAEVLVGHWGCPTLTAEVLAVAPQLRLFAYAAGTVKWQVTDAVWERDIVVTSAAAANAVPVAEYTVAMILLANKGVLLFREWLRDPTATGPARPERGRQLPAPGRARRRVARRPARDRAARAVRPRRRGLRPVPRPRTRRRGSASRRSTTSTSCARRSDVLSLHAPDVDATRGMIGAAQLAALRDGATFLNTARPALVDAAALEAELDVRPHRRRSSTSPSPIRCPPATRCSRCPNVFVTPHVAGAMGNELHRLAELAVVEVERFARGRAAAAPGAARGPGPHRVTRDCVPGLCSVTMRHLGVEEVARLAAEAGLRAIEWGGDVHVPPGDADAAARARIATRRRRASSCASYGSYLLADGDGSTDDGRRGCSTPRSTLGAPNVRVWAPFGVEPGSPRTGEVVDALARGQRARPPSAISPSGSSSTAAR